MIFNDFKKLQPFIRRRFIKNPWEIEEKAKLGDWQKFKEILNKAPDVDPPDYDR